jgi:uncharacterized protein (TIGR00369 family)
MEVINLKSQQPNSSLCFACGVDSKIGLKMRFFNSGPGEVRADYTVDDEYQGYPGIVHGGVVAAMLDEVTARVNMGGDNPRFMFTARLNIRYRQHVPTGEKLRLIGKVVQNKKRTAKARGEIYNLNGELLAEAEALLVDIPDEEMKSLDPEELGWRVYSLDD